jgi:hypothetical protein
MNPVDFRLDRHLPDGVSSISPVPIGSPPTINPVDFRLNHHIASNQHTASVFPHSSPTCPTPRTFHNNTYSCLSEESISFIPKELSRVNPHRYRYFPIHWKKFPDGTDDISIEGFYPENHLYGENIIFFASFHNNGITLSQFSVLIVLLQSFIQSLIIVLPYYPVGTNERVEVEGKVATANTYSMLLSSLPSIGKPIRLMIYDLHSLQNRFYFHGSCCPSLHTAIPLLLNRIASSEISAVVFPDEGAEKRFGKYFQKHSRLERIVCGKVRDGNERIVSVQDGDPAGNVLPVLFIILANDFLL